MLLSRGVQKYHSPSLFFEFLLILFIGFRFQVGGDWYTYLDGLEIFNKTSLQEVLFLKYEIGFNFLSWITQELGANIYGINLVCATIFVSGLTKLCREQPYPWLAVIVAVPYLIIVVAMGYTRQATAIGFLMYGFGYITQGRVIPYLVIVFFAASFHKTSIVFLALPLFKPGAGYLRFLLGAILLAIMSTVSVVIEQAETFYLHYVIENMESDGGLVRVLMNLPPVIILLYNWKKWGEKYQDRWLWAYMSILAVACIPLVSLASTVVDRMALYLIPLQLVAWSRLPVLIGWRIRHTFLAVISYYASVEFIWLVYGNFSSSWIPYDNLLFPSF